MARIPAGVIERLKSEIAIERLAEARGVVFERRGADLHGRCPFHEDKTPSLVVTPSKNLWHCLGACQAGGTVIDWVMRVEGVSFRHAVELLLNDSLPLAAAAPGAAPPKRSTVQKLPASLERNTEDAKLLVQVIDYYHETLQAESRSARVPRAPRDRLAGSRSRRSSLGFANRTLGCGCRRRRGRRALRSADGCRSIGLWRESGHEHFNGSLVIPVIAPRVRSTEVYGRKINDNLRPGTPLHLYLPVRIVACGTRRRSQRLPK